ncbi:hypothetical protein HMPREF1982_03311 [Clostridiales bacterium oral taxon 876 str. F0540]|nr:hypothetical protein HMPREF1982_03311 [Clostridiales bacterium oral taxon 876 str. F0540]
MKWYILALLLIILLLLPIPIKIRLSYLNKCLKLYIYRFQINPLKKKDKAEHKKKPKRTEIKRKLNFSDILFIIKNINRNKLKPVLKLQILLNYGLADAAVTGISYGVISYLISLVPNFFSIPFKIKKYKSTINPDFNNFKLETKIESIIYISLVKIIYMSFIVIKSFISIKKSHKKK